jgi:hypothetical protein
MPVAASSTGRAGLPNVISRTATDGRQSKARIAQLSAHRPRRFTTPRLADSTRSPLEQHIEGVGQLLVRLLTGNFEEAVAARKEKRPPQFRD